MQICDAGVDQFVAQGLCLAKQLFGNPLLPVGTVTLLRDGDLYTQRRMSCADPSVIHLRLGPGDFSFYYELAQEIPHLLNSRLRDVYVEGLNLIFAKKLFAQTSRDWAPFEQSLQNNSPVYCGSYCMMEDLWSVVGDENILTFLQQAVYAPCHKGWQKIDIDAWLQSLDSDFATEARKVILRHYARVGAAFKAASGMAGYSFDKPSTPGAGSV